MKDNTIRGIAAAGLVGATLGLGALTNVDEPLPTPIQYETTASSEILIPGEDVGGNYVTREEWDVWEQEFRHFLTVELPQKTNERIVKILEVKEKDGYLDNIKIWRTATESTTSGEMKKREEE